MREQPYGTATTLRYDCCAQQLDGRLRTDAKANELERRQRPLEVLSTTLYPVSIFFLD